MGAGGKGEEDGGKTERAHSVLLSKVISPHSLHKLLQWTFVPAGSTDDSLALNQAPFWGKNRHGDRGLFHLTANSTKTHRSSYIVNQLADA